MESADAPLRVLILFTEVFANGGIQRFNQTMLDACVLLGIDCQVLSLNDTPAAVEAGRSKFSVKGFSGNRRQFALAVAGAFVRDPYDWVLVGHVNFITLAVAVLTLLPFHRAKTILIAHGIEVWSGLHRVRRYALSRVYRVLCVSRYTRQRILEQAPALAADRLLIFPNAFADTWAHVVPVACRSASARFILSVTRLERGDRYKGIASVIEAFSMLTDESIQYFIIGHGKDMPFLQLVAARCGVTERVHFLGGISDAELIALYENCEAFVLPSGKEGFGIVFLEAMFFGAPVIAASEKGASEVVRNEDTGLSVRYGDTIAIKEAIERLGSDAALRERVCANGHAMVSEGGIFTFQRFANRCAEVFGLVETSAL